MTAIEARTLSGLEPAKSLVALSVATKEGMERRKQPGEARSMNSVHRALSAPPVPRGIPAD
jgi:hypothetical protein